ncbi:MAG: hypothetical protein DHS20C11_16350 [Lysobacteraceae bacterium]|nr:MAG: hypothetical protein DHS20C11_16350 [Xanthomonadaceae bacterium]
MQWLFSLDSRKMTYNQRMISGTLLRDLYALFICTAVLSACSSTNDRPDLQRLYQQSRQVEQPPVILVHGILGARLADSESGKEAWFGSLGRLAFSNYSELALSIDPDTLEPVPSGLQTSGLADKAAGQDYYGNVIEILKTAGGYEQGEPGVAAQASDRRYYVFTYDWRQDNVVSAQRLADLVDQIKVDYADPSLQVDIIAHSMGGLITRYYLRYGRLDTLNDNRFPVNYAGAKHVRRVLLLGTPNLGSVSSLHAFIEGRKVGFRAIPTEVLATMPSVYQLFPHNLHNWLITPSGKPLNRDIFKVRIWRSFKWSIFDPEVRARVIKQAPDEAAGQAWLDMMERYFEKRLERARRFVWSLTVPVPEAEYQLVVFGGDCQIDPSENAG